MKRILNIFLFVCFVINLQAQVQYRFTENEGASAPVKVSDANISGHTVDKNTGEHIGFINITLKGTTIGTSTDATGHFFLKNLPVGEYTIVASAVGYKTINKKISLSKAKTLELNF